MWKQVTRNHLVTVVVRVLLLIVIIIVSGVVVVKIVVVIVGRGGRVVVVVTVVVSCGTGVAWLILRKDYWEKHESKMFSIKKHVVYPVPEDEDDTIRLVYILYYSSNHLYDPTCMCVVL